MSRVPVFVPAARAELFAAVEYYEAKQEGLGLAFAVNVETALLRACKHPERCALLAVAVSQTPMRRVLVARFPYIVVFTASERQVRVVAVAHTSRRPAYWAGR